MNALDHSNDPLQALRQMMLVTKPGREALIVVHPNEALGCNYCGMHRRALATRTTSHDTTVAIIATRLKVLTSVRSAHVQNGTSRMCVED